MLLLGDSHTRECASEVRQQLNTQYEVTGFINPRSGMKDIKESAKMNMAQLTREDIVVLWGGSNNVARNNSVVGMKYILDLLINSTHTSVILLSVAHRQDLSNDSCVNREVKVFNRSLQNRLKSFGKVELIEKEFSTKHGQHLNSRGKVSMASRTARTLESMIKSKVDPISRKWYNDKVTESQICQHQVTQEKTGFDDTTTDAVHSVNTVKEIGYPVMIKASDGDTILDGKNVSPINLGWQQKQLLAQHSESINCTSKLSNSESKVTELNRSSNRSRKIPATRSNDFLWEN
jgi:hypothetical protein